MIGCVECMSGRELPITSWNIPNWGIQNKLIVSIAN